MSRVDRLFDRVESLEVTQRDILAALQNYERKPEPEVMRPPRPDSPFAVVLSPVMSVRGVRAAGYYFAVGGKEYGRVVGNVYSTDEVEAKAQAQRLVLEHLARGLR